MNRRRYTYTSTFKVGSRCWHVWGDEVVERDVVAVADKGFVLVTTDEPYRPVMIREAELFHSRKEAQESLGK